MRKVSSGERRKNLCKISLKYVDIFSSDKRVKYLQRKEKCLKHFKVNELQPTDEKPPEYPSKIEIRHSNSGWKHFLSDKVFSQFSVGRFGAAKKNLEIGEIIFTDRLWTGVKKYQILSLNY